VSIIASACKKPSCNEDAIDKAMVESINHVGQMMGLATIADLLRMKQAWLW